MSVDAQPDGGTSLTTSALLVRRVLDDAADGELTRQELIEESELAPRTIDAATEELEAAGEIVKMRKYDDLRQVVCKRCE